jgi:hypothetical protein
MKQIGWFVMIVIATTIFGCVDSMITNTNQNTSTITIRMDPSCGCPVATDGNGVGAVNSAIAIDVNYDSARSSFAVSVSGGQPDYHLWVNGTALADVYLPGTFVDLPAGTYSVYVTDATGYSSPHLTVTLLT